MNLKRAAIAVLCACVLFVSGAVPNAFADWYDDIKSDRYVEINGNKFVADTFYGVNAYYNEDGSVYHCGELVERFYREAYGLDVEIRSTEPRLRMNTPGYKLVTPKTPKAGDVVFVSAEMRGSYDHWAIVKYYSDGYLTLFEQNVVYNGKAGVERKLKYPSGSYILFSPVSEGEMPDPVLGSSVSAESTTAEITETPTTAKQTTTQLTTIRLTTTKTATTTKEVTTSKPTTTKVTTTKPVTVKPSTTVKQTTTVRETTAASTTVTAETTAPIFVYTQSQTTEMIMQAVDLNHTYNNSSEIGTEENKARE